MDRIINFAKSLLSRKFLLAIGTILVLIANGQYIEAVYVVLGYLGVEGVGDAAERYNKAKPTEVTVIE